MTEHWYIRPSNMGRTVLCPGWIKQAQALALEPQPPGEAAERGTLIHGMISDVLTGETSTTDEVVQRAVDFIRGKFEGAARTAVEKDAERDGIGGTMDAVAGFADRYEIIDTKTGWYDPPTHSVYWQGKTYACLTGGTMPVVFHWYNPDRDTFDPVSFNANELEFAWRQIQGAKVVSEEPEWWKNLNAHPDACRYCPCLPHCPAARATVDVVLAQPEEREVTETQLARDMEACEVARKIIDEVRKRAKEWLKSGKDLDGWKLGRASARKAIKTELLPGALGEMAARYSLTTSLILESVSLSHAAAVRLLVDHISGPNKAAKEREAKAFLEELGLVAEGKEGEPKLLRS